jgi:hypothetical protein
VADELSEALELLCTGLRLEARLPVKVSIPPTVERQLERAEPAQPRMSVK